MFDRKTSWPWSKVIWIQSNWNSMVLFCNHYLEVVAESKHLNKFFNFFEEVQDHLKSQPQGYHFTCITLIHMYFIIWKCFYISWNYLYLVIVLRSKEFCEYYIRVEKFQIWDLQVGFDLKENVRFWYVHVNTCKVNNTCN